jgi:hypothetical protein
MKGKSSPQSQPSYQRKSFSSALDTFFAENCPQLGGRLTRGKIVQEIEKLVEIFFPPTNRMKMGQVIWHAIDKDEKAGYGKRIEHCKIQPVVLDLIHASDIEAVIQGIAKRHRQKRTIVRLFQQAYEQNGVLTNADVGAIMRLSPITISKYVREYEKEHNALVPRRGNIHDIGRTLSHKKIICYKHFYQGKSIEQTARETYHSPTAVARYINDFMRVRECLKAGWHVNKIAFSTGLSISLTKQYVELMKYNNSS